MTSSVADKTPIPASSWRRHQDPPGLWFAVGIGSVAIHLLAFWLLRSSNNVSLWFPEQNQSAVPIELIDVTPKSTQPSAEKSSTSANQNVEIVTANATPQSENQPFPDSQTQVLPQEPVNTTPSPTIEPESTPSPITEPEATTSPTTEPSPSPAPTSPATAEPTTEAKPMLQLPVGEIPWKRREEILLGEGKPLPSNIPSVTPEQVQQSPLVEENTPGDDVGNGESSPTGENTNTPSTDNPVNSPDTPTPTSSPTSSPDTGKVPYEQYTPEPSPDLTNSPTQNNSSNSTAAGAIASLTPVTETEARQLANDLPQILPKYEGSISKTVDSSYLPGNLSIKPAELLVALVIDSNGKFQQAEIRSINPPDLAGEKSSYMQLINQLFANESFTPGRNQDGTTPELSNVFVRIKIEQASP